jgi:hypothetical protein
MPQNPQNKARQIVAGAGKNILDYVIRRFNASSAWAEVSPCGWTSAGKPLNAISRSNRSPESAEERLLFKAPRVRIGSWFRAELDCS